MKKAGKLLAGAIAILMIIAGCAADPAKTVNQQLYPYLIVNTAGEIRVAKGAAVTELLIPDDVYINGKDKATVFVGYEDPSDKAALESVVVGSGITKISNEAFKDAEGLKEVEFEKGSKLEAIGNAAFQNTGLETITLPESPVVIGENAFTGNEALTSVDLGGTTEVGKGAFTGNSALASVDFGAVSTIGENAFSNTGLTEVVLPETSVTIGENAFTGNEALTSVDLGGTTEVGKGAFTGNSALTSVDFGTVSSIGENAFSNTGLTEVVLPETSVTIGKGAFSGNEALTSVDLGGTTTVGEGAFQGNSALKDVDFGSVNRIESNAFNGTNLGSITIPDTVTSIRGGAFQNAGVTSVTIEGSGPSTISSTAFNNNTITSLDIPARLTGSAVGTFGSSIRNLYVHGGGSRGDTVANGAFQGLGSLTNVYIYGTEKIGDNAFNGASNLSNIYLGRGLETVGKGAFVGAGSADTEYTLPATVTDAREAFDTDDVVYQDFEIIIGGVHASKFDVTLQVWPAGKEDKTNLAEIIAEAVKDTTPAGSNKYVDGVTAPAKDDSKSTYHNDIYMDLADVTISAVLPGKASNTEGSETQHTTSGIINVDVLDRSIDFTTSGSVGLVDGNTSTSVEIPLEYRGDDITHIAEDGFNENVSVKIPAGNAISNIGSGAFEGNTAFDKENFDNLFKGDEEHPNKTVTIGDNAFNGATGITEEKEDGKHHLVIPGNAASIGSGAFVDTGADVITIPATTEGIDREYKPGAFGPSEDTEKVVIEGPMDDSDLTIDEILKAFGGWDESTDDYAGENPNVTEIHIPSDLLDQMDNLGEALNKVFPNLDKVVIDYVDGHTTVENLGGLENVTTVILPDEMTEIAEGAFEGCTNLKKVDTEKDGKIIPDSLPSHITSIGNNAFSGTDLGAGSDKPYGGELVNGGTPDADVTGGIFSTIEGPFSIGDGAFAGTSIGPNLNLENASSIGNGAFAGIDEGKEGLNVKVPSNVTENIDDKFTAKPESGTEHDKHDETVLFDNLVIAGPTDDNDGIVGKLTGDNPNDAADDIGEPADLVIGNAVIKDKVTAIGENAFVGVGAEKDKPLTVTIPDSVTSIGAGAFKDAPLTVDESGNILSDDGSKLIITDKGGNSALPDSIKEIGQDAFNNSGLVADKDGNNIEPDVFLPDNDELKIGQGALVGVDIGEKLVIPPTSASIEEAVGIYGENDKVLELTVPIHLIDTADEAKALYEKFKNLEKITVTGSTADSSKEITGLNNWADSLKSVDLSDSGAKKITADSTVEGTMTKLEEVILPGSLETIGDNAFNGCTSLDSISYKNNEGKIVNDRLPSTVNEIGKDAFKDSALGEGHENYGGVLKNDGASNADITGGLLGDITGGLTIGAGAFEGTSIGPVLNIPAGTTLIGDGAFKDIVNGGQNGHLNIKLPAAVSWNIDDIFTGTENHDETVFIDNLIINGSGSVGQLTGENPNTSPSATAPKNQAELVLDNVVVQDGVEGIGENAFVGVAVADGETLKVILPESERFTEIGDSAFKDTALSADPVSGVLIGTGDTADTEKLVIKNDKGESKLPSAVTEIGENAFNNSGLVANENGDPINVGEFVPEKVKDIGKGAFVGVDIGDSLLIPDSIDTVQGITDIYGENITSVKTLTVPLDLLTEDKISELRSAFPNVETLIVTPSDGLSDKTLAPLRDLSDEGNAAWSGLISVDLSGSGVEGLGDDVFKNLNLNDLKLSETIKNVGDNAFKDFDEKLMNATVFESLKNLEEIGDNAFAGTNIAGNGNEIIIPDGVVSIGTGAFSDINGGAGSSASNALKVTLPVAVTENIDDFFTSEENHDQTVFISELEIVKGDGAEGTTVGHLAGEKGGYPDQTPNTNVGDQAEIVIGSIVVGDGITEIGEGAFVGVGAEDEKLSVALPETGSLIIGENAFKGAGLAVDTDGKISGGAADLVINNGKLPGSVTSIGDGAFQDSGLASDNGTVDISDFIDNGKLNSVGKDAFAGVDVGDVDTITIPDTITSIDDGAFAVVDGTSSDDNYVVSEHPGINVTIPGSLLDSNTGLDDIFLPSDGYSEDGKIGRPAHFGEVTITGDEAFDTGNIAGDNDSGADGVDVVIDSLIISESSDVTIGDMGNIGVVESGDSDGKLHITLPDKGKITIKGPFSDGPKMIDPSTGKPVTPAQNGVVFFEPDGMLPSTDSGITIGEDAFAQEAGKPAPSYPANDAGDPFWSESNITSGGNYSSDVVNVSRIEESAFAGNTAVKRITIPKECTYIGPNAFAGCTGLEEIIFEGPRTETIVIEDNAFSGCTNLKYVSTLENGKYTKGDENVAGFPENSLTSLDNGVFANTGFETVKLDSSVTSVSSSAFDSDVGYEITLPVQGFMNETEYPEGGYPEDASSMEVTFSGTWGGNSFTIQSPEGPKKYGYDYTWTINGNKGNENALPAVGITDIVAGKGGSLTWDNKEYSVTFTLPENWTTEDGSKTVTQTVKFGETVTLTGSFRNDETGKSATGFIVDNDGFKLSDENKLISELNQPLNINIESDDMTGLADIEYPISININGQTISGTANKGDKWSDMKVNGSTLGALYPDTYVSSTAPVDGKLPAGTGSALSSTDIVLPNTAGTNYYLYAKLEITKNGSTSTEYYQIGTSEDVLKPVAENGYDTSFSSDDGVIVEGKIRKSGKVSVNKVAHEYPIYVNNAPYADSVTYGETFGAAFGASGVNGFVYSSTSGNGPYGNDELISANTNVPAQSSNHTPIYLDRVYSVNVSSSDSSINLNNLNGYYKNGAVINLPNPSKIGYTFTGWSGNGVVNNSITVSSSSVNLSVTPGFTPNKYTVTIQLYVNGASKGVIDSFEVTYDSIYPSKSFSIPSGSGVSVTNNYPSGTTVKITQNTTFYIHCNYTSGGAITYPDGSNAYLYKDSSGRWVEYLVTNECANAYRNDVLNQKNAGETNKWAIVTESQAKSIYLDSTLRTGLLEWMKEKTSKEDFWIDSDTHYAFLGATEEQGGVDYVIQDYAGGTKIVLLVRYW